MNFNERLIRSRKLLQKQKIDALLVTSSALITYLTGYSGFSKEEREAFIIITKNKQFIFSDGRYSTAIKKYITHFVFIELYPQLPLKKAITKISSQEKIKSIGFEGNNISYLEFRVLSSIFKKLKPIDISELRLLKESNEITYIQKACNIGDLAFKYVLKKMKLGISEKELAWVLEKYIKEKGGELSFSTIIAFGENSAVPHHQTSDQKLKTDSIILFDFGVKVNNYCSDMTRTIFFGKADNRFREMYKTVFNSQQAAINFIESQLNYSSNEVPALRNEMRSNTFKSSRFALKNSNNISAAGADKIARDFITMHGFPTIPHSLGHGIGLLVHEKPTLSPKSKDQLTDGMVFSIEPGIYLPNYGGVRIEDLFTIRNGKLEQLTKSNRELIEV